MTKKVNPELFRIKKYNFINTPNINFFDDTNQFYYIKRNIYFFIKFFKKYKYFIFYFKLQRNTFKTFKVFFFGYFLKSSNFLFLTKKNFYRKKKIILNIKKKKKIIIINKYFKNFKKKNFKIKYKRNYFLKNYIKYFLKQKINKTKNKIKKKIFFKTLILKKNIYDLIELKKPKKLYKLKFFLYKRNLIFKHLLVIWFFLNFLKKKKINFWKLYFKKFFKITNFKFRMWPKFLRGVKWKFKYIKNLNLNFNNFIKFLKKKKKKKFIKIKNINRFIYLKNQKSKNWKSNFLFNFFNFKYLFIQFKKKKNLKQKKKILIQNIYSLFKKKFLNFNFKIFIKNKINKKKVNFLKFFFWNVYKHSFFKTFSFLKRKYFLSFLYTIWYKNVSFLSFFLWTGLKKISNGERFIVKIFKNFLKTLILNKYGILGIKIILKGKLFKKRRKKKFLFRKGSINLVTLKKDVKFINYNIVTRAGTYNFKCWLVFL